MAHPLHEIIADVIETSLPHDLLLVRDPACSGQQRIPLFLALEKSRATWICDVDALIVVNQEVRVIVEIDESDVKPTKISGKFFNTVLADCYIHDSVGGAIRMAEAVTFMKFLSTSGLPTRTHKRRQWKNIAKTIRSRLPLGNIAAYELFYGVPDDFRSGELLSEVDLAVAKALRPTLANINLGHELVV